MTTRRSTVPTRGLTDVAAGSMVLAVVGAADEESLDDLMTKAHALLTFDDVRTLVIDVRATTLVSDAAVEEFAALSLRARSVGRQLRFAGVPERLADVVDRIETRAAGLGPVVEGVEE